MRNIALIDDADVVKRILKHLGVWDLQPESPRLAVRKAAPIGELSPGKKKAFANLREETQRMPDCLAVQ